MVLQQAEWAAETALNDICNYLQISERLGTGGQPQRAQFSALAGAGYRVVINLAVSTSPNAVPDEDSLVTEHGMRYYHLPVPWESPTLAHVAQFFALMDIHSRERVFVHCVKNMRVAVFVFLYRVCREGIPVAVAQADMVRIWQPEGVWRDLLDTALEAPGLCEIR